MKRRATTPDERRLFETVAAASHPVTAPVKSAKPPPRARRGAAEPEARLDLHGLTEAAAHRALLTFLCGARKQGLKRILVITGKGKQRAPDAPFNMELDRRARGILKTAVPRWLNEKEFAALVNEARPAHRRHGGDGATACHLAQMKQSFETLVIETKGPGLYEATGGVRGFLGHAGIANGLLTCFIRHTSASLLIQENADPDVLADLENFMRRTVSCDPKLYRHTTEGPDDMPSHIRAALTQTSLAIPVRAATMALGVWQGIYLFEHRDAPHAREILLHLIGE